METVHSTKPIENKTAVLTALKEGAVLDYAPIEGGLIMIKDGKPTEVQPTIDTFLELQSREEIKHTGTMRQGHALFHGRVESYELPKKSQKA